MSTLEERQRCLEAGMNDHLSKPIDPSLLFETVGKFYVPPQAPNDRSAAAGSLPTVEPGHATAPPALPPSAACKRTELRAPALDDLPTIPGLNIADGVARLAGNRKLYLKLLRQFAEQQGTATAQIEAALAANDAALAERLAHTIKGLARQPGRPGRSTGCREAGTGHRREGVTRCPPPTFNDFRVALDDFLAHLRAALAPAEPLPPTASPPAAFDVAHAAPVVAETYGYLQHRVDGAAEANRVGQIFLDPFDGFQQLFRGGVVDEVLGRMEIDLLGQSCFDSSPMMEGSHGPR